MNSADVIFAASRKDAIKLIKENFEESDKWVTRAVVVIFEAQTASEQLTDSTNEWNGVGFNGADAEILSSFAKQIIAFNAGESQYRYPLSVRQLAIARKRISKYAGQILNVMLAAVPA